MLKYCVKKWDENKDALEKAIREIDWVDYKTLMELVVKHILGGEWDAENITVIDNGDYQGTLLFVIPMRTYQPSEGQYLMTSIWYGSCALCDALEGALHENYGNKEMMTHDLMQICLHLIQNMIHPFKSPWDRDDFKEVEE